MKKVLATLMLLGSLGQVRADEVVFYRCTDPAGALTLQNMPCPKGQQQEKKVMQGVGRTPAATPMPMPRTAATVVPAAAMPAAVADLQPTLAPAPTDASPVIATEDRLPPPVLFQCTTYDKDTYITESEEQQSRCVAMQTVGLDGNPQRGAGEACEMVHDQCARVADGGLCEAWKKRLGETEVALRFGRAENQARNQSEFERVQRIVEASTCTD